MYRLFVLACLISAINAAALEGKTRIIGGKSISIEDAPYQVSVYDAVYHIHKCGGSIVSPNYILTAAHCAGLVPQAYRIRIGSSRRIEDGDLFNVIAVIKHENYHFDGPVPVNDIALMRIVPTIEPNGKTIKIIGLPEQGEKFTGQNGFLSGWGSIAPRKPADKLQSLTVKIIRRETCDKNYIRFHGIRDGQICAEHNDRDKDLCDGDSGGPLVIGGKQVGIVSWSGPGCAIPGLPGVYTEVAAYREWIDKHIRA